MYFKKYITSSGLTSRKLHLFVILQNTKRISDADVFPDHSKFLNMTDGHRAHALDVFFQVKTVIKS